VHVHHVVSKLLGFDSIQLSSPIIYVRQIVCLRNVILILYKKQPPLFLSPAGHSKWTSKTVKEVKHVSTGLILNLFISNTNVTADRKIIWLRK
jgi:hypothetical protein